MLMLKQFGISTAQLSYTMVPETRFLVFLILAFTATCVNSLCDGYQPTELEFAAIQKVETGGVSDPRYAVGDGGRSIGPYQITYSYYLAALEYDQSLPPYITLRGPYSYYNGQRVMRAYSCRYTNQSRLGRKPTFEDFARNHKGGPNGYKKSSTIGYYNKVKATLGKLSGKLLLTQAPARRP